MHSLSDAAATRQAKHLLDQQIAAERALAALSEDLGWTLRYAYQLKPGDHVVTKTHEGKLTNVSHGPVGTVIHFDANVCEFLDERDLVTVAVDVPELF